MKVVEVTWKDPTIDAGWQDDDDHDAELPDMKSYGILVSNTKRQVCIAGSYDKSQKAYADRSKFPKGCVKSVKVIHRT